MKKIEVSTSEFAEVLSEWVAETVANTLAMLHRRTELIEIAEVNEKSEKIIFELLMLYSHITVRIAQAFFDDTKQRDNSLNFFHRILYDRRFKDQDTNYTEVMTTFSKRYEEYDEFFTESPDLLNWVVALGIHIYRKPILSATLLHFFVAQIGEFIVATDKLIKGYDINES